MGDSIGRMSRRDVLVSAGAVVGGLALGAPALARDRRGRRPEPRFEPLFDIGIDGELQAEMGPAKAGERVIVLVTGGTFDGPAMRGMVLPGGGDWLVRRPDGVSELDMRITLRTDDEQLIYARCHGYIDKSPGVRERERRGEAVGADEYYWRITPVFETASAKYQWLTRIVAVGVGDGSSGRPEYTVYAVR